jgi:hypothetical protein
MQESKLDSQAVEIIGKNKLINELLKAGIEVASPIRDRGIDLIAYIDIDKDNKLQSFVACPLQMKAATKHRFGIERKYEKFSNLLLVFVWYVSDPNSNVIYALAYREAIEVGEEMGWITTKAWQEGNYYNTNEPSKKLLTLLEKYQMTSEKWRDKVKNTGKSFL